MCAEMFRVVSTTLIASGNGMTLYYLQPALWGFVLLVSFIGYGALLRRLLFAREHIGWANEAAWGMAVIIVVGGVLNSLSAISGPLIIILIAIGFALAFVDVIRNRTSVAESIRVSMREHPFAFALKVLGYGCIALLAGIQYIGSIDVISYASLSNYYSLTDDLKGYFAFPKQMLETGAIAPDNFSGYRLISGLGGQAILHALMLVLFDFRNFLLIDGGVALVICIGLVMHLGVQNGLAYPWRLALVLFFLIIPFYPALRINSSSFTTGMVLFLALFAFLNRDAPRYATPVRNAIIIGLLAAGACALKTNLIPPLVAILGLSYLWYVISTHTRKEAVIEAFLVPAFVLLMLLPWMVSLERSSGTMLYPIFGMGFDEYRYGNYLSEDYAGGLAIRQKLAIIFGQFLFRDIYLFLLVGGAVACIGAGMKRRGATCAFTLGSILAVIGIMLKADLSNLVPFNRYLFVCVFTSLIAVLAELMTEVSHRIAAKQPSSSRKYGTATFSDSMAIVALVTLLTTGVALFWHYRYTELAVNMYGTLLNRSSGYPSTGGGRIFPESERARYRQAQESVPPRVAILSRDDATLLYDYGRNPIYNINDPGTCSPPPGMPYFQGPEAVAAYLLSYHIRYVAYAYADQAGYPVITNLWRHMPGRPYMHRIGERAKVALDRVLGELGASRQRIYDDGLLFIIDLKTSAAIPTIYREPNYFQIEKILVLAWARTQGFDKNKVWTDGHGVIEGFSYQRKAEDNVLVLNTFGYHPWKGDMKRLNLVLSINGSPLPFIGNFENSYVFSLASVREPMTSITIDSSTFVPRREGIRFGKDDDQKTLGIDVDTIQISN